LREKGRGAGVKGRGRFEIIKSFKLQLKKKTRELPCPGISLVLTSRMPLREKSSGLDNHFSYYKYVLDPLLFRPPVCLRLLATAKRLPDIGKIITYMEMLQVKSRAMAIDRALFHI
jgi:hypothetical protein